MILITGSTGFVGRHLVAKLARSFSKSSLLCWIWSKAGRDDALGKSLVGRLGLPAQLVDLKNGTGTKIRTTPETIIHLADVGELGTRNLLQAIPNLGPRVHIIFTGSSDIMSGRPDCSHRFSETGPYFPANASGRSKLSTELILIQECQRNNFRLTILRLPTVYGANSRPNSLFNILKRQVVANSLLARIDWPGQTDLLHVDDAVDSIVKFIQSPPPPGSPQIYIVSAESLALKQIFPLLCRSLGISYRPITLPPLFWKMLGSLRPLLFLLEPVFPAWIYDKLWQASLFTTDVICADNSKYRNRFPGWRPRYLKSHLPSLDATSEEIQHFSQLEHIWWGARTPVGQMRYDYKAKNFKKYIPDLENRTVLEIGCGDGEFTKRISDFGAKIIATDVTPAVILRGRRLFRHPNVKFEVDNAEKMKYASKSMDVVCGVSILHHVNIAKVLAESYRVLKPGGRLFFTEPNLVNPQIYLGLHIPYLRNRWEFSPSETALVRWQVESLLRRVGFKTVSVVNYDFMHPLTPPGLFNIVHGISNLLERTPLIKEISGSLILYAKK